MRFQFFSFSVTCITLFTFWLISQEYSFSQKILQNSEYMLWLWSFEYLTKVQYLRKMSSLWIKNYFCFILQTFFLFPVSPFFWLFVCLVALSSCFLFPYYFTQLLNSYGQFVLFYLWPVLYTDPSVIRRFSALIIESNWILLIHNFWFFSAEQPWLLKR